MFAVVTTAACVTPTSLSPVTCDASALRGVLARVPLPQHGLELVVADSCLPGAGRGLFACTTTTEAQLLPSGTPLCGLAAGTWHAQAIWGVRTPTLIVPPCGKVSEQVLFTYLAI